MHLQCTTCILRHFFNDDFKEFLVASRIRTNSSIEALGIGVMESQSLADGYRSIFLYCKNNKNESDEAFEDSKSKVCISAKTCNRTNHFSPNSAVCLVVAKFTSVMSIKMTSLGKQDSVIVVYVNEKNRRKWHL